MGNHKEQERLGTSIPGTDFIVLHSFSGAEKDDSKGLTLGYTQIQKTFFPFAPIFPQFHKSWNPPNHPSFCILTCRDLREENLTAKNSFLSLSHSTFTYLLNEGVVNPSNQKCSPALKIHHVLEAIQLLHVVKKKKKKKNYLQSFQEVKENQ